MVSVHELDDTEYRTFYWTGRVVGHRDGSGDTSVEGIEHVLRREGGTLLHADCVSGCIVFLLFTGVGV